MKDLEMNFAEGLARKILLRKRGATTPGNPSQGFLADDLGTFLGLLVNDDLIGSMNLIVRQNAVQQHEPPWPPSFPVIHPLVQYPRDPVPYYVIDLHVHRLLPRRLRRHRSRRSRLAQPPALTVSVVVVIVVGIGSG